MQVRGIVQRAELVENPPGSDRIEMVLWGQGVGPDKPRSMVVPYELLLQDPSLDPDQIHGHGFEARRGMARHSRLGKTRNLRHL